MGSKTQEMSIKMANVTIVNFPIFEKLVEICPIFKIYSQILLDKFLCYFLYTFMISCDYLKVKNTVI